MTRPSGAVTLCFCVLIVVAAAALHIGWLIPNHDNEWYLIAAARMLDGGRYLTDFADPNPPLIMLLNMPPIILSRLAHVDTYLCFTVYVALLILLALWLSKGPLDLCLGEEGGRAGPTLVALAAVLAWLPGYDFGQREHLFTILFLPFLFWSAARTAKGPARLAVLDCIIVILGALGAAIKPFYVSVPVGLLALRLVGEKNWRVLRDPAILLFAATIAAYAAFVPIAYPEYLPAAFLQKMGYAAWNSPLAPLVYRVVLALLPIGALVLCALLAPLGRIARLTLWHCLTASSLCLLLAVAQKTDWPYHWLPAIELAFAGLAVATAALMRGLRPNGEMAAPAIGLLACIAVPAAVHLIRPFGQFSTLARVSYAHDPLFVRLRAAAPDQPVLLVTSGFLMGFPSMAGVRLGASAPSQVLLPGAVMLGEAGIAERRPAVELRRRAVQQLADDLERFQPLIVAVDRQSRKQALPDNFDLLAFYSSDPRFRRAWSRYRAVQGVTGWDLYRRVANRDRP